MDNAQQIIELPIGKLHESPFNPRKRFDEMYLRDLAEDIKAHGRVLQPLLVRPRVPELFKGSDDPNAIVGHELVFGHCRLRAATLAGLSTVPCMVRAMTDLEVKRAQISENLQRKDVHPIEEAEGFQALIADHGETADTIALMIGGPNRRSYVYSRLKLLQAVPALREACLDGTIGAEIAVKVARYPAAIQPKALQAIATARLDLKDGGKLSTRQIDDLLRNTFTLGLDSALFDPEDAALVPAAGACGACPKLSGNAPEFEDLLQERVLGGSYKVKGNPRLCTDPDCYGTKKVAHLAADVIARQRMGEIVVSGSKAKAALDSAGRPKGQYIALDQVKAALTKSKAKSLSGAPIAKDIVLIQNPHTGKMVEAVHADTLKAAGVKNPNEKKDNKAATPSQVAVERENNRATAEQRTEANKQLLSAVHAAMGRAEFGRFELELIARHLLEQTTYGDHSEALAHLYPGRPGDLEATIKEMTPRQLVLFSLACAMSDNVSIGSWELDARPELLELAAEHYGIQRVQAPAPEPSLPHPPAAQAQGGAAVDDENEPTESTAAPAPAKPLPVAAWPFPTKAAAAPPSTAAQAQGKAAPAKRAKAAEQPGGAAAPKVKVDDGGLTATVGSSAAVATHEEAAA